MLSRTDGPELNAPLLSTPDTPWGSKPGPALYCTDTASQPHRLNCGLFDGKALRRRLATVPSATAFCHSMMAARLPMLSSHSRILKPNDIPGEGAPPAAYAVHACSTGAQPPWHAAQQRPGLQCPQAGQA